MLGWGFHSLQLIVWPYSYLMTFIMSIEIIQVWQRSSKGVSRYWADIAWCTHRPNDRCKTENSMPLFSKGGINSLWLWILRQGFTADCTRDNYRKKSTRKFTVVVINQSCYRRKSYNWKWHLWKNYISESSKKSDISKENKP